MAVVYKHFVTLLLLLVSSLLVDAGGQVDAAKGHFRRKDFPDHDHQSKTNELKIKQVRNNSEHRTKAVQVHPTNKPNDKIAHVLAQTGSTAVLHCDVGNLTGVVNVTILWIKWKGEKTFEILSSNDKILSLDKRFAALNKTDPQDWSLYIRYTQPSDEGIYQCQTCLDSYPSNSTLVELKLKEAQAIIIDGPRKRVEKPGSPLRLSCVLNNSIEAPTYIFWYHEDRMINYDLNDGATVRDGRQGSELIFPMAQRKHAGNYSCVPSNARQASVEVIFSSDGEASDTENSEKSCGKKSHPQDHIVNMLVLISAFHLYRRHYRLQT